MLVLQNSRKSWHRESRMPSHSGWMNRMFTCKRLDHSVRMSTTVNTQSRAGRRHGWSDVLNAVSVFFSSKITCKDMHSYIASLRIVYSLEIRPDFQRVHVHVVNTALSPFYSNRSGKLFSVTSEYIYMLDKTDQSAVRNASFSKCFRRNRINSFEYFIHLMQSLYHYQHIPCSHLQKVALQR